VDSTGKATILVSIASDGIQEGAETLLVTAGGKTAYILINDSGIAKTGTSGPDSLVGSVGSDTIDGGAGVDTVFYGYSQSSYNITRGVSSWTVSSLEDGVDVLSNLERLHFADLSVALDLGTNQSAGQAAMLLGAVLPGKLALDPSKQQLMGTVISLFDAGYTLADLAGALMRLDIWTTLTGSNDKLAIGAYLYTNIYRAGSAMAGDPATSYWAATIANEAIQGSGLASLAGSMGGQSHIGLSDLAQKGLAYIAPESLTYGVSQVGGMGNDVLEGANLVFTLKTNLASGTVVPYALSGAGISTQDFAWAQSLSGNMTVGSYGEASVWVYTAMDKLTEGPETLVFTARGLSSSVVIQDSSKAPEPVIVLTPPSTSVNEGSYATFTLSTTNVTAGTVYQYTLAGTGITSGDIAGGQLTGAISINAAGTATISIPVAADVSTEGPETLVVTVAGQTASTLINDASTAPASYTLNASALELKEGETALFTVFTTNLIAGTILNYVISGANITTDDFSDGRLQGTVSIDNFGKGLISIPIKADGVLESSETMIVSLIGVPSASTSLKIVDIDGGRGGGGGGGGGG
jgi:hypothetical protein